MKKRRKGNLVTGIKKVIKGSLIIVGGGLGILFIGLFFQSPPTKAEFQTLKEINSLEHKFILELFSDIKDDLTEIKKVLYEKAIQNKR